MEQTREREFLVKIGEALLKNEPAPFKLTAVWNLYREWAHYDRSTSADDPRN